MSLVRPATPADIPELLRHREMLFDSLGLDLDRSGWRAATLRTYQETLGSDDMAVFVVDGDDCLAASGVGLIDRRLPGPQTPNGRWGHISGMVTDPAYRRQGHARAIMVELLGWFRDREVARIELHGSKDGTPLYRQFGFAEHPIATALTWWSTHP